MQLELSKILIVRSLTLLLSVCFATALPAEDEPASASDEKPKTVKLSGVFESLDAKEVKADNEHLASLKIKRILPHGTKVSKGQNIVWFETEEIDKTIKDAEIDLRLSKLTQEDEEFSYKQFLETQTLDRKAAELARQNAQQDFDNFVQVDREHQKATAEQNLKSAVASLENAEEELKQLEQMYKEDDLTEESEEIVLKRAKQSVEFAQFRLDGTKITSDRTVKQTIPRTQAQQDESLARAQLTHQQKMHDLDSARRRRDIEIARKRDKLKDEEEKVKEMRDERKKAVLQSPLDGILLHGKLTRGKLSDKPSALEEGSTVTGKQVIATVVNSARLQVRIDLNEDQLSKLAVGDKCKVTAKAFPDHQFNGRVKSISPIAYAGNKFDCLVTIKRGKDSPAIVPTMHCDVEFAEKGKPGDDKKPADEPKQPADKTKQPDDKKKPSGDKQDDAGEKKNDQGKKKD